MVLLILLIVDVSFDMVDGVSKKNGEIDGCESLAKSTPSKAMRPSATTYFSLANELQS
jgi:hypothetical protein